jgi:hypothetical protein
LSSTEMNFAAPGASGICSAKALGLLNLQLEAPAGTRDFPVWPR